MTQTLRAAKPVRTTQQRGTRLIAVTIVDTITVWNYVKIDKKNDRLRRPKDGKSGFCSAVLHMLFLLYLSRLLIKKFNLPGR